MRRWRHVLLAIVLGLAGITLAGCTAARNDLGTHVSSCFRVLPAARAAAGTGATFDGVLLLTGNNVIKAVSGVPQVGPPAPVLLMDVAHRATCLVAFKGTFTLSSVSNGWTPAAGPYLRAIVVMRQSNGHLVATVLLRRLPRALHFSRGLPFGR